MTSIEPEIWVERPREAITFYEAAFGATVLHRVGAGDDLVAHLAVDAARFWVSNTAPNRFSPRSLGGATGRLLLVVTDPDATFARAIQAGAVEVAAPADEHGWRLGRLVDPAGHEWEIGRPLGDWPLPAA